MEDEDTIINTGAKTNMDKYALGSWSKLSDMYLALKNMIDEITMPIKITIKKETSIMLNIFFLFPFALSSDTNRDVTAVIPDVMNVIATK
jgi:hypothetical protein